MKISVTIITYNEAKNIARCLQSVHDIADEVIVVDSYSTDQTVSIAQSLGAKVFSHAFLGHIEQKNLAISHAQFDYILSLDADEALDTTLIEEIKGIKKSAHPAMAYIGNRYNNYCGQWINHGAWKSDKKVRFFHKQIGKWGGINPHDKIVLAESVQPETLRGQILHWSYYSIAEHKGRIEKYAHIAAKAYQLQGKTSSWVKIIMSPAFRFFRDYFFKLGFLDGKHGFIIAMLTAKEVYLKYKLLKRLKAKG
jgi:glycosyltransferase involved in cell wall biosynthesis